VGDALAQALRDAEVPTPVRDLAIPRDWHAHGTRPEILADLGLTAQDVARDVIEAVSRLEPQATVVPAARAARH
jgi:1-deoxy-D-xylulose-5-phosphate synthase